MAKPLIKPDQFGAHLAKKQGDRSEVQFERDTGVVRQTIRQLKAGAQLPTPAILQKLGYDLFYREKETQTEEAVERGLRRKK